MSSSSGTSSWPLLPCSLTALTPARWIGPHSNHQLHRSAHAPSSHTPSTPTPSTLLFLPFLLLPLPASSSYTPSTFTPSIPAHSTPAPSTPAPPTPAPTPPIPPPHVPSSITRRPPSPWHSILLPTWMQGTLVGTLLNKTAIDLIFRADAQDNLPTPQCILLPPGSKSELPPVLTSPTPLSCFMLSISFSLSPDPPFINPLS